MVHIDWDSVGLGEMNDTDLAKRLGVNSCTVCKERNKRKIIPFFWRHRTREGWTSRNNQLSLDLNPAKRD